MTNLEIGLIGILWVITGIWLANRWIAVDRKNGKHLNESGCWAMCIMFAPVILIGAILRQTLDEWK